MKAAAVTLDQVREQPARQDRRRDPTGHAAGGRNQVKLLDQGMPTLTEIC